MSPPPPRRTQEERRAATRAQLLDAAVECLLERGYAATTVSEVLERAGLARGTLLHHFPTKADLMVAATSHLVNVRMARFRKTAELISPTQDRLQAMVDLAWADLNSPAFFVALELWVAARTDAELRDVLVVEEAKLFASMRDGFASVLGDRYADDPRAATAVEFTIDVLTGLSMTTILTGNLGRRGPLLRRWKRALAVLLGELDAERLVETRTTGRTSHAN